MTRIILALGLLALASCAAETGPPGGGSAGNSVSPVSGTSGKDR